MRWWSMWEFYVILFLLIMLTSTPIISNYQANSACQRLGFENYVGGRPNSCEDKEGNLYYVKLDCGFFMCEAKEITVGENRIV